MEWVHGAVERQQVRGGDGMNEPRRRERTELSELEAYGAEAQHRDKNISAYSEWVGQESRMGRLCRREVERWTAQ